MVLRTAFCVIIWIFINLFRVVVISGVVRICWPWLNTGTFTYLATCTADGRHTYKEEDLADRVRQMLGRLRLSGLLLVVFACLTQIPWILTIRYFSDGLVYGALAR